MARDVYYIQLMERVNYKNHEQIQRIFTQWATLEQLAERGDQVAHAILIDMKSVLGYYRPEETTLTPEEIDLIKRLLIINYHITMFNRNEGVQLGINGEYETEDEELTAGLKAFIKYHSNECPITEYVEGMVKEETKREPIKPQYHTGSRKCVRN